MLLGSISDIFCWAAFLTYFVGQHFWRILLGSISYSYFVEQHFWRHQQTGSHYQTSDWFVGNLLGIPSVGARTGIRERETGLRVQLHWVLKERQLNLFEAEEIIKLEKILPIQRNMKLIKLCPTIVLLVNFLDAAPLEFAFKVSSVLIWTFDLKWYLKWNDTSAD